MKVCSAICMGNALRKVTDSFRHGHRFFYTNLTVSSFPWEPLPTDTFTRRLLRESRTACRMRPSLSRNKLNAKISIVSDRHIQATAETHKRGGIHSIYRFKRFLKLSRFWSTSPASGRRFQNGDAACLRGLARAPHGKTRLFGQITPLVKRLRPLAFH